MGDRFSLSYVATIFGFALVACSTGNTVGGLPPLTTDLPSGNPILSFGDGGAKTDGAMASADADAGTSGNDGAVILSPMGPTVQVLSPAQASDPMTDTVLTQSTVAVKCKVQMATGTTSPIDTSSVKVVWLGSAANNPVDKTKDISAPATATSTPGEYQGTLQLTGAKSGPIQIACLASDSSTPANTGMASAQILVDLGPTITILSPITGAFFARTVSVQFKVDPAPLAATDPGAAIASKTLRVADKVISSIGAPDSQGIYTVNVSFRDAVFLQPLDGLTSVKVSATNSRTPTAVSSESVQTFIADNTPPTLTAITPRVPSPQPTLVAGLIPLSVKATDAAGLTMGSVFARVGGVDVVLAPTSDPTIFSGAFETRNLPSYVVQPNVEYFGTDSVGNQANLGYVVVVDNQAPYSSLDPPSVSEWHYDSTSGKNYCTSVFDPLGSDAVNDQQIVPPGAEFRARIEDVGNGLQMTGPSVIPMAGVNNAKVDLYLQDDTTVPLVVDNDGVLGKQISGEYDCDDINPLIVNTNKVRVVKFTSAKPDGAGNYASATSGSFVTAPFAGFCSADPTATAPSDFACPESSDLWVVMHARVNVNTPAIYGIAVDDNNCVGTFYDLAGNGFADGWACGVLRVEDTLGNVGVSPPLRFCLDTDGNTADCAFMLMPTCTGVYDGSAIVPAQTCAPPLSFKDDPLWQLYLK